LLVCGWRWKACQLAVYGAADAGGGVPGVLREVPERQLGSLLTWEDFPGSRLMRESRVLPAASAATGGERGGWRWRLAGDAALRHRYPRLPTAGRV
jgi:hypothetical protein